ncbi:MAG: gamma-glutamyltransferase family protein [Alphaproteobacteria bacterium]|nr:gamma-glutamyltransferase family protein [Alphaproteobacteria bacterium]
MFTTRPEIRGTKAVVASTHWLATMAGWSMIEAGGNAFDAAVATGLALHIVEPHQNGFGGDMPIILRSARTGKVEVICGQGVSPKAATIDAFAKRGINVAPGTGLLAACVPGSFDAWMTLLRDYGTMEFAEIIAPAIGYANDGFAVIPMLHDTLNAVAEIFTKEWTSSGATYLVNGNVPLVGELSVNTQLAKTLARLVDESKTGRTREGRIEAARAQFYEGFVAEEIDRFCRETEWLDGTGERQGGLLTGDDMASWHATVETPVTIDYAGLQVHKTQTWGQGPVALQQLAILKGYELATLDPVGPDFIHLVVEAAKLAFADREAWYGDPDHVDVPIETLIGDAYAAGRRGLIGDEASMEFRPGRPDGRDPQLPQYVMQGFAAALDGAPAGDAALDVGEPSLLPGGDPTRGPVPSPVAGDTVHLDAVDADGNMISCMPSGGWLQSSPVIPALGFCLGSRMQMFWLEDGMASSLRPGVRPRTTLSPGLATRDGEPELAFGSPGGDQQDQWALTMLLRHIHHGLNLQAACDAPGFNSVHAPSSFYPRPCRPGVIEAENRLPEATLRELTQRGHRVELVGDWALGRMTAVGVEKSGGKTILKGAAQPRAAQAYAVGC